jgi:hypothetical protein
MLEEGQHLGGAEIIHIQPAHGSCPPNGHKAEEAHEAISIAQDHIRAFLRFLVSGGEISAGLDTLTGTTSWRRAMFGWQRSTRQRQVRRG